MRTGGPSLRSPVTPREPSIRLSISCPDEREVGPLPEPAARAAIAKPVEAQGVAVEEVALQLIVQETRGYPYFLQEWGKHAWDIATASPITRHDVALASKEAVAE